MNSFISGEAGTKWQKVGEEKKPEKLICYECNSLYDERCADPFNPYSLGYVDCNLKDPPRHLNETFRKPILCRKTVQKGNILLGYNNTFIYLSS